MYELGREGWHFNNIWLGVTCENQRTANERIPLLLQTSAAVRFLSCEPLLEEIDINKAMYPEGGNSFFGFTDGFGYEAFIDQVIVGGESGPKARPCDLEWIRSLVRQCQYADVPVFVKQLGSNPKIQVHGCHQPPANWCDFGSTGKGSNPDEWPEDIRVREFPRDLNLLGGK